MFSISRVFSVNGASEKLDNLRPAAPNFSRVESALAAEPVALNKLTLIKIVFDEYSRM